jgi:ferredoxin
MRISKEKCVGCANCVPICTVGAIYIGDDGLAEINTETCVECHNCYRSLSFEHLPPTLTRSGRRILKKISLRFEPAPDICPTEAIVPEDLEWPRIVRRAFSDPMVTHESTGVHGRGTEEVKTNDVSHRIKQGEVGIVVEFGRPGIGVYFREVQKATRVLAEAGVTFEQGNPVYQMMTDTAKGDIREDVHDEKVLSCIVEITTTINDTIATLNILKEICKTADTVISIGVSTICDKDGEEPLRDILTQAGYETGWAKLNLGFGRATDLAFTNEENL